MGKKRKKICKAIMVEKQSELNQTNFTQYTQDNANMQQKIVMGKKKVKFLNNAVTACGTKQK